MRALVRKLATIIVIWLITAVAVAFAVWLVPGIDFTGPPLIDPETGLEVTTLSSLIIFAAVLAVLNGFIKPVLRVISMPITWLTLGLFALVINTIILYLALWIGNGFFDTGFIIESFLSALGAAIVISIVTAILNAITGVKHKQAKR